MIRLLTTKRISKSLKTITIGEINVIKALLTSLFIVSIGSNAIASDRWSTTSSTSAYIHSITDHQKDRVYRSQRSVEVCEKNNLIRDHTASTIKGSLIGGLVGNNLLKGDHNAAFGAILGAMIGHSNSVQNTPKGFVCTDRLVLQDRTEVIYSHSIMDITIDGVRQSIRFTKRSH